jgi:hypothetical protein
MSDVPVIRPYDPVADAARAYHEALHRIETICGLGYTSHEYEHDREPGDRYLRDVADPWRAEIERLAAADGMHVRTFVAYDAMSYTFGFESGRAAASLQLPDGRDHPHCGHANLLMYGREIPEEWFECYGLQLAAARLRSSARVDAGSGSAHDLHQTVALRNAASASSSPPGPCGTST